MTERVLRADHAHALLDHLHTVFSLLISLVRLSYIRVHPLGGLVDPAFLLFLVSRSIPAQVPSVVHHEAKVLIVVDACRYVSVILNELFRGNTAVCLLTIHYIMVHFECLKELLKDLVFTLFPRDDIWVLAGIVDTSDVVDVDNSTSISVELLKGFLDDLKTERGQVTSHHPKKLVIVDCGIPVKVESIEYHCHVIIWHFNAVVLESFAELFTI